MMMEVAVIMFITQWLLVHANERNDSSSETILSVHLEAEVSGSLVEINVQVNPCKTGEFLAAEDIFSDQLRPEDVVINQQRPPEDVVSEQLRPTEDVSRTRRLTCKPCTVCVQAQETLRECTESLDTQCGICTTVGVNRTCIVVTQESDHERSDQTTHAILPKGSKQNVQVATASSSDVKESEGYSPEFIGALITAALSLVMFIILSVTAPLVVYLKVRDWCRYRRSRGGSQESRTCPATCSLLVDCYKLTPVDETDVTGINMGNQTNIIHCNDQPTNHRLIRYNQLENTCCRPNQETVNCDQQSQCRQEQPSDLCVTHCDQESQYCQNDQQIANCLKLCEQQSQCRQEQPTDLCVTECDQESQCGQYDKETANCLRLCEQSKSTKATADPSLCDTLRSGSQYFQHDYQTPNCLTLCGQQSHCRPEQATDLRVTHCD